MRISLLFPFLAITCVTLAQQVPDTLFKPPVGDPTFGGTHHPVVVLDEAHNNFHTLAGRYRAFGDLLQRDGYDMRPGTQFFNAESLKGMDVLVIANALNDANDQTWNLPNPSAFIPAEIEAVKDWVNKGGSLFLIADHMPFAGAAHDLAMAFGFDFLNCYALDRGQRTVEQFHASNGLDGTDPIVSGTLTGLRVDTIVTFTGSAFHLPDGADPILALPDTYVLWETTEAGQFPENTPRRSAEGWYQAAVMEYGKGRVAVFGEAAMFSAQLAGPQAHPMGFNKPEAHENVTLLRNLMAWLAHAPAR